MSVFRDKTLLMSEKNGQILVGRRSEKQRIREFSSN